MTDTWTDAQLDTALADLARDLDRDADRDAAVLAAVRERLLGDDTRRDDGVEPDVVALGRPSVRRPSVRRWWLATGLAAAAVVVAGTAVAVTRAHDPGRVAPAGPIGATVAAPDPLRSDLAAVPRPLPAAGDGEVLFETSGRGDAAFGDAFAVAAPLDGAVDSLALTYSFVCARPVADTARPSGPFRVSDDAGTTGELASCPTVGAAVPTVGTVSPPTVVGRTGIRVSTPDPDVVWRLVVSLAPR